MTEEDFKVEFGAFQEWCLKKYGRDISDERLIEIWLEFEEE